MKEGSTKETASEEIIRKAEAGAAALRPVARLISQQIHEVRATYRLAKIILGIAMATLVVGIVSLIMPLLMPLLTRN